MLTSFTFKAYIPIFSQDSEKMINRNLNYLNRSKQIFKLQIYQVKEKKKKLQQDMKINR